MVYRIYGTLDQWSFGLMGHWTNGLSDLWDIGLKETGVIKNEPMGYQIDDLPDQRYIKVILDPCMVPLGYHTPVVRRAIDKSLNSAPLV